MFFIRGAPTESVAPTESRLCGRTVDSGGRFHGCPHVREPTERSRPARVRRGARRARPRLAAVEPQASGEQGSPQFPVARTPPHLDPWVVELAGRSRRPRRLRAGRAAQTQATAALRAIPIASPRRMAVVGLKGGTGKSTLSVALANTYARERGENVLLFDADTRHGVLPLRTGTSPVASAHEIAATGDPGRPENLAGSLSRSPDGVWVLPSGRTPAQSAAMDERVYTGAMNALYRHFPITISDCGAGLASPLMQRVLSGCHSLVLATSATADGVLTSENAIAWLRSAGYAELTGRSVVALTNATHSPKARAKGPGIGVEEARRRFATSCADVIAVPADRHLAVGSYLDLDALAQPTRAAIIAVAAAALRAAAAA